MKLNIQETIKRNVQEALIRVSKNQSERSSKNLNLDHFKILFEKKEEKKRNRVKQNKLD